MSAAMSNLPVVKLSGTWVYRDGRKGFTLFVGVRNDGEKTAAIRDILLKGVPLRDTSGEMEVIVASGGSSCILDTEDPKTHLTLDPGSKGRIKVEVPKDVFTAAKIVTLEIETSSGLQYLSNISLL